MSETYWQQRDSETWCPRDPRLDKENGPRDNGGRIHCFSRLHQKDSK